MDVRERRELERERRRELAYSAAQKLARSVILPSVQRFANELDWKVVPRSLKPSGDMVAVESRDTAKEVDGTLVLTVCVRPQAAKIACTVLLKMLERGRLITTDDEEILKAKKLFPIGVEESDFRSWLDSQLEKCAEQDSDDE